MLKKEKLRHEYSARNYGPEIKIDLPVKKAKIQTCQKLIARKVLCFSHSKVSKLDLINSRTVSINSRKASNVSKLDSSLDPRTFRESRIENRVSSIELRGTVNLPLSGTVTSSPGHSQSNGMAESAVKTAKKLIKKANKDGTDPWFAILDHRNMPSDGMRSSPTQRRRTRTLLSTSEKLVKPKLAEGVQEEKRKIRTKQAFYYNRNARDLPPLKTGDTVRIQPTNTPKEPWKKATVQKQINVRSYKVLTEDGSALRRNRRHLKATPESHTPTTQTSKQTELPTKQETNTSDPSSSEVAIQQESVIKQPATDSASQASGGNQTRSGRVTRPPSYLKDFVC